MAHPELSEAGRALQARRWDPAVVLARAAATVISRAAELPPTTRAEVIERLQREDGTGDE